MNSFEPRGETAFYFVWFNPAFISLKFFNGVGTQATAVFPTHLGTHRGAAEPGSLGGGDDPVAGL